jgi:hypothetical protein
VVEELERELAWLERNQEALAELSRLEELRVRVEDEIAVHRSTPAFIPAKRRSPAASSLWTKARRLHSITAKHGT